eukprot:scaffold17586_cov63-Phaeocystis_antarctica.AAC.2
MAGGGRGEAGARGCRHAAQGTSPSGEGKDEQETLPVRLRYVVRRAQSINPLPAPVVLRTTEISRDLPTPPRAFPDQTG